MEPDDELENSLDVLDNEPIKEAEEDEEDIVLPLNDCCEKVEVFSTIQINFEDIKRILFRKYQYYVYIIGLMLVQSIFLQYWCSCLWCFFPTQTQTFVESVTTFRNYLIVRSIMVCIIVLLVIILRTGSLVENQATFAALSEVVVSGYFFWLSPSYTISLITFQHMVGGMREAWASYLTDAVLFRTTDFHILITTSSGKYLPLSCKKYLDFRWHVTTRVKKSERNKVIRSDSCRVPGITMRDFYKWIQIRMKSEVCEKNPPIFFVRDCFNYVAKTKSYDRLQNIIRSPWFDVGGINWAGKLMFINERDEKCIIALKDYKNLFIVKIRIYKVPLCGKFITNMLLFHSFAVICIEAEGTLTWWSCEKNMKYIVFQKNPDISKVRDYIAGDKRCANWYWKAPQLICEETVDRIPLKEIVDICEDEDEMRNTYQGITDNCQRFTGKVFHKCTGKCLDYGFFQRTVSQVTYWLASKVQANSMARRFALGVVEGFTKFELFEELGLSWWGVVSVNLVCVAITIATFII